MLPFEINKAKNLIDKLAKNKHWDIPKKTDITKPLHDIAFSCSSKLPHPLLDIGEFSSAGPDFQSSTNKVPKSKMVRTLVAATEGMPDSFLGGDLELTLKLGIYAGAYWEEVISQSDATHYAEEFVNQFMTGSGEKLVDDGGLSYAMKYSKEGKQLMQQISKAFIDKMHINGGNFSEISLKDDDIRPPSFSWKSSPALKILVGGTQKLIVNLAYICYDVVNSTWQAVISVEIRDDFGVTEGDLTNASTTAKMGMGGLVDMWTLQHQRGKKPFTTVFNFSFLCYGNY